MTENSPSKNNDIESEIKEQLYILYLEIKGEIAKKNIEIDQDQFNDYVKSVKLSTLIHYIKELIYMLLNLKSPNEHTPSLPEETNVEIKNSEINQMENHIRKLEYDIRYYLQREFQHKIQRDALEMKLNAYMEMENEFEELKEKVKYEGGRFLNNERKDNEIIILRQENCILKKELEKHNENTKTYEKTIKKEQEVIQDLNSHITDLNKKINHLEMFSIKDIKPNSNNSSINININNNAGTESKWVIKQEADENSKSNNFTLKKKNYNKNTFTKNYSKYPCNLNINSKFNVREQRDFNGFQIKNHRAHNKITNNIDNNSNMFAATYNKILNNLSVKGNKTPVKKKNNEKIKKNGSSVSMYEEFEKSVLENKYLSNKGSSRYRSTIKKNGYNKIMSPIPNSKFPLTSKSRMVKNNNINKKYLHREKSSVSHSALNIK